MKKFITEEDLKYSIYTSDIKKDDMKGLIKFINDKFNNLIQDKVVVAYSDRFGSNKYIKYGKIEKEDHVSIKMKMLPAPWETKNSTITTELDSLRFLRLSEIIFVE